MPQWPMPAEPASAAISVRDVSSDAHARMAVMNLPDGVALRPLDMNRDSRGSFTEVFREEWDTGISPVQWNIVSSEAGTLRGVHVHIRHDDYLTTLRGRASVGLRDLRRGSPAQGGRGPPRLPAEPPPAPPVPPRRAPRVF